MGASEGVDGVIGMDGSVGTIVWVRRRNGSWWPGRILGQDELSASHLMSPRSGTPVKLLGRDDASVDWYNLEKSKRVKAFRCGEFDACIERAEASQSVLTKKREKYARREDAILHALELEKQQKSEAETNSVNDKYSGDFKKELNINSSSEICPKDNESIDLGKSLNRKPQIRGKVVFFEEVNGSRLLNARQGGHGKQVYWEDDNCENMSRMRGLQDFGLWIAPSNQEVSLSVACESSEAVSDHVDVISDCVECVNDASGGKTPLVDKEKRSHGLVEEYLVKRCDRHRPLVQVLQKSAKLTAVRSLQAECESPSILGQEEQHMGAICHVNRSRCMCSPADSSDCLDHSGCSLDLMQLSPTQIGCSNGLQQPCSLAGEDVSSGLINEIDTGSSVRHLVDGDMEDCATLPQDYTPFVPESRNSGTHVRQGVSTLGNQENLGKMSNDYKTSISYCQAISLRNDEAPGTADMGVSKWHMKGKRNTRNLAKRSLEVLNGKNSVFSSDSCNGYPTGSLYGKNKKRGISIMGQESSSGPGFYEKAEVLNHACDDDDDDSIFFEKGLKNRLVGFGKRSYPSMIKAFKDHPVCGITDYDDSHEMFSSVWEVDEPPHLALRPYWVEADECLDTSFVHPLNVEMDSPLIDVNLKVQASYHGEHVPLVSLMSRLNGKAIIGHPVHIEILEDGVTNLLFPRNGKGLDSTAVIEHAAPPHVWRTGRRTAMQRVPRPYLAVSALEGEETELIPYSDREHRPLFKKSDAAPTHQASSLTITDHCRLTSVKSNKSVSKKGSLSSHKTRTLSSIATEQKRNGMNTSAKQERDGGSVLDGLIKPGGTVPLVTCVPVKVAFSRLREAVGRPASAGMTRWGLLGGLAVGNPL